jgi:hypothetical protein
VEVAEYSVAQGIDHEPAFVWWVPYTLKKRNRIVAAVSKRYHKREYKYGFRVPKTVEEAKEIDKECGNTLWMDSVEKEMAAVNVAFKFLDDDDVIPPGYTEVNGSHLILTLRWRLSPKESLRCRWAQSLRHYSSRTRASF